MWKVAMTLIYRVDSCQKHRNEYIMKVAIVLRLDVPSEISWVTSDGCFFHSSH